LLLFPFIIFYINSNERDNTIKAITFFLIFSLLALANERADFHTEVKSYQDTQLLQQHFLALDADNDKDYVAQDVNVNDLLSSPSKKVVKDTVYLQALLIGTIGVLYMMPDSVTNWDSSDNDKSLSEKWKENVKAGPVMDEDDFFINYIGHPVSGAWYYTLARNDGYDEFESFLYSVFLSTFVWEYGYEAFAEIPSIQDLFSTPIIGSLMGEGMYYLEMQLDANGGLVWGSRYLGNVSYFFLNPFGRIADSMSSVLDVSVTMRFETYQQQSYMQQTRYNESLSKPYQFYNPYYGVLLNFEF
jgi:hypothetical protein